MLIKTKISLAVIASMMASSVMATAQEDPDVLYPTTDSTAYAVSQPKIAFKYVPSATGYLIDLVKLEDSTSGTPVEPGDDNKCGEVVATKFVTASDADLTCGVTSLPNGDIPETTVCEWLAPTNLEDGMYGVVVSNIDLANIDIPITIPSRDDVNCAGKDVAGNPPSNPFPPPS